MNLTEFFSHGLALIGPFDIRVLLFLFLLCLIGEAVGLFVPYLFETTWLMIGYQVGHRVLSPVYLVLLLLTCIAGRELGALALYYVSQSGSALLIKYKNRFVPSAEVVNKTPMRLFKKIDITASPFTVAMGRLMWLRIPLTLILGVRRKLKTLAIGVAISSLIYEGVYLTLGAIVGTTAKVEPVTLILYFLAILTTIYVVTFGIRRLIRLITKRRRSAATP